jgi:flagellar biosynthesis GTPase FlhF
VLIVVVTMENNDDGNDASWLEESGELKAIPKDLIKGKTIDTCIYEKALLEECAQVIRSDVQNDTLLGTLAGHLPDSIAMNDLEREAVFMEQTAQSASQVIAALHKLGIPYRRPDDYFAEMVKDDKHMEKIQGKLLEEKERLQRIQKRKEEKEAAKQAKQLQVEREKQKKQQAKKFQENVENLKEQRKKKKMNNKLKATSEYSEGEEQDDDDDFPVELLDVEEFSGNSKSHWSANKKKRPKVAVNRGIIKKRKPARRPRKS